LKDYRDCAGSFRVFGTNGPIGWHTAQLAGGPGIVIGRKGAYRGVHYSPGPFWAIDTAFYLKPKRSVSWKWAYYELLRVDINGMDSGSAIPSTSREDFYSLPVCLPSANLLKSFDVVFAPLFEMLITLEAESEKLAALRDYLLPRLLSGRVRMGEAAG
jgi:type I restriction enzyme S subunit